MRSGCDRRRPSVLVGSPLSRFTSDDRERSACSGEQPSAPTPTFIKLTSADVVHSFWVPELAGKTDVIPNRINELWIALKNRALRRAMRAILRCGTRADAPARLCRHSGKFCGMDSSAAAAGGGASVGCCGAGSQTVRSAGMHQLPRRCRHRRQRPLRPRPDPSDEPRDIWLRARCRTTPENLAKWIDDPDTFKHGSLMPSMHLTKPQIDQITAYLVTLK